MTRRLDPSPLLAVLAETADLPRGARRVLEGVFWGVGHDEKGEARIVPLSRVLAFPPSTTGGLD